MDKEKINNYISVGGIIGGLYMFLSMVLSSNSGEGGGYILFIPIFWPALGIIILVGFFIGAILLLIGASSQDYLYQIFNILFGIVFGALIGESIRRIKENKNEKSK